MKKLVILMIVMMFMVPVSIVMADENRDEKAGRLFLFQKCDESLIGNSGYDSFGCPNIGTGPWASKGKGHDDDDDDDHDDD